MQRIRLMIKVVPQSGRCGFVWDQKQSVLKCFLKSAPEKNKANDELIMLIAQTLGISRAAVSIMGGAASRRKMICIESTLSQEHIFLLLGVMHDVGSKQQSIG
jgi:uncharacterized protein YggU (UPF0235/DUF167 family)